jgi:hypothetical protein
VIGPVQFVFVHRLVGNLIQLKVRKLNLIWKGN